ncbi:MAG: ferritin-like domain-containing protein [Bacteroidetes bacterium]|nr:ferritin-like domain-containing protein [Bacteroidota bacterium]
MTFKEWHQYFQSNRDHFDYIPWSGEPELDGFEEKLITRSIQQFQKGENSDGKHLMQLSEKMNDDYYTLSIKGLIQEEQNHAAALGQFMAQEKIDTIGNHWLDTIFKRIIKTPSLEFTIMVLLAAELVATVYYKALRQATYSRTLKAICRQILVDEQMHIQFQTSALQLFYLKHNSFGRFLFRNFYLAFMLLTSYVIWFQYSNVLKKGGYSFTKCMYALLKEFAKAMRMIIGKAPIAQPQNVNQTC